MDTMVIGNEINIFGIMALSWFRDKVYGMAVLAGSIMEMVGRVFLSLLICHGPSQTSTIILPRKIKKYGGSTLKSSYYLALMRRTLCDTLILARA